MVKIFKYIDKSIKAKFFIIIGFVFFLAIIANIFLQYKASQEAIMERVANEANSMSGLLMATRRIYHHQFINSGIPLNEKTLGFIPAHALKRISDDYKNWVNTGLTFNNVSDRPRNKENLADALELEAIEYFKKHREEKDRLVPYKDEKQVSYYHFSKPIWVEAYCLQCHGSRESAPITIRNKYDSAYDYKVGDLSGVMSIKIPIDSLEKAELKNIFQNSAVNITLSFFILSLIGFVVNKLVIKKIELLGTIAQSIASGKFDENLKIGSMDEFGKVYLTLLYMVKKNQEREETINETTDLLKNVINSSHDFIFVKDKDLKTILCNKSFAAALDKDPKDLIGKTDIENGWDPELVNGNQKKGIRGFINDDKDALNGNNVRNLSDPCNVNGAIRFFDTRKLPLYNKAGEVFGVLGVSRDVTEQKLIEQKVKDALAFNQIIFETSPIGILTYKVTGECISVNPAASKVTNGKKEQLLQQNFYHIESWKKSGLLDIAKEVLITNTVINKEIQMKTTFGKNAWYEIIFSTFYIKDEQHLLLFINDISARKNAEESLKESEQYNRTLFENLPIGLVLSEMDGTLIDINFELARIMGRKIEDTLKLANQDITPSTYFEEEKKQLESLTIKGKYGPYEKEYIHKDGHLVPVRLNGLLLKRNGIDYIWSTVEDITEQKLITDTQIFLAQKGWQDDEEFLVSIVRYLGKTLKMDYVFIDKLKDDPEIAETVALYAIGEIQTNIHYPLHHTPCENVIGKELCSYAREIQKLFPQDDLLKELNAESYIGIPLWNSKGKPIGLIAAMDRNPMDNFHIAKTLLQIAAIRVSGELERKQNEENIRKLSIAIEQNPASIVITDIGGTIEYVNPKFTHLTGYTLEEVKGKNPRFLKSGNTTLEEYKNLWETIKSGGVWRGEFTNKKKNGEIYMELAIISPLFNDKKVITHFVAVKEDITEKTKKEELIRHSQKMDAIGKFTSGIAHDFNNILGIILGYSELLQMTIPKSQASWKYIDEIQTAGERAQKLTSKLLAFTRKQAISVETFNINDLIQKEEDMLQKILTARIHIVLNLSEDLWNVTLDKGLLEDAILNICINAMHAMPSGGTLNISTKNISLKEKKVLNLNIPQGDYVMLSITDTGIGMDSKTKEKIFDPFFTTKGTKGTGLGMSQVYGFVKQSKASIHVDSELGHGAKITLYFPRSQEPSKDILNDSVDSKKHFGNEVILVVDDESAILRLTDNILTAHGYKVLLAENGKLALEILKNEKIDLIVSDVIMPEMDGYQLAVEAKRLYPKVKIQITSGFDDEYNVSAESEFLHKRKITKPYNSENLLKRIRELLDEEN